MSCPFSFPPSSTRSSMVLHGPPWSSICTLPLILSHLCLTLIIRHLKLTILGESNDAHREVYEGEKKHDSHLSHELIAGAASFAGMKAFEDHQRKEGMLPYPWSPIPMQ